MTEVTVAAGGTVGLEVTQAGDSDKWRQANDSGHESDSVHYNWSATGGSVTPDGSEPWKSTFTAPNESGEYYVKVKIDDEPAAVISPDRGRRDDSAVTRTVKVIVQQKKWDIDLAIGKYRQEDGTVKENGRMVLPQDQTGDDPAPEHVKVAAGATIDLLVEAATDIDHWKMEPVGDEGYDDDTVTYSWEASSGQIVGDADKRSAKWQAPTEAGTYTITCTIDDTPKEIAADEDGTRDDTSVERTVEVEVVNGESSATLKLYKDEELTEEVDDAVGGTAYIVLEVKLGEGQHLVSNSATLRVEENYAQHSDTEKRWDSAVSFGSGWQKKDSNGEWQNSVSSPQSTNNGDDDEYYRKVWPWSTTSTPLGHNENHSIKLVKVDGGEETELKFAGAVGEGETKGPSGISADVKNLVIKSVDPSEYFLVKSDDTEPVDFSVQLADYDEDAEYSLTLTIRHTADPSAIIKTIAQTGTGLTHTISWDLTDDSGTPVTTYGGYFTFDLIVSKNGGDTQHYRSPYLTLTQDDLLLETDENGNLVRSTGGKIKTIFKYKLSEAPKSGSASVHFFKELDEVSSKTGLSKQNRWNPEDPPVTVSLDLGEPPSVRAIMTALDDRGDSYRDHLPKRMLNYNKGHAAYMKYAALTFNLIGNGNIGSHLIEWSKVKDANGGIVSNWGHNNSWEANSSQTTINSDDPADYWRENGPIPVSNDMNNTVAQNTSKHCWWVKADTSYMISPSTAHNSANAGMYWCKPDGTPKFFGDKYGNYRAWRFQILDGQYSDEGHTPIKHYPGAEYGVSRDYLRVHEDQGQIGSSGCIAVKPGLMEQVWPRLRNIGDAAAAWGNKYYIPLMVFDRNGSTNPPHESASWGSNSP